MVELLSRAGAAMSGENWGAFVALARFHERMRKTEAQGRARKCAVSVSPGFSVIAYNIYAWAGSVRCSSNRARADEVASATLTEH